MGKGLESEAKDFSERVITPTNPSYSDRRKYLLGRLMDSVKKSTQISERDYEVTVNVRD